MGVNSALLTQLFAQIEQITETRIKLEVNISSLVGRVEMLERNAGAVATLASQLETLTQKCANLEQQLNKLNFDKLKQETNAPTVVK